MNSQDILWKIIHERTTLNFDQIIPLLRELNVGNERDIGFLEDNLVSHACPYIIYDTVKKTAEILRKAGYENPYSNQYPWIELSNAELRIEVIKKLKGGRKNFFGELPEELRKLGYGNRYELQTIEDYVITKYNSELIDEIVILGLKLLEN